MLVANPASSFYTFPGNLSEPQIQHPSQFVGLLLRGAGLPWPNYGHVVLAKPSPILFYPISSTEVSSCDSAHRFGGQVSADIKLLVCKQHEIFA